MSETDDLQTNRPLNKAELFKRACEVNKLRKEAQLPLRDIRRMIAAEEDRLAWAEYTALVGQYTPVYEELRKKVHQDSIDTGRDIALSAGGIWLLNSKAMKLFEEFLEDKGHFRPVLRGIPYGSGHQC